MILLKLTNTIFHFKGKISEAKSNTSFKRVFLKMNKEQIGKIIALKCLFGFLYFKMKK